MSWTSYKLSEICEIVKGTASAMNELPGDFPMVVTAAARKSSQNFQIEGEAVCIPLVSSTGHGNAAINRLHYQSGKFAVASILAAIIPQSSHVDCKYLFYYLTALKDRILVPLMKGTSNVSLTLGSLKSVSVELPSIERQRELVRMIDDVQSKLEHRLSAVEDTELDSKVVLQNAFNEIVAGTGYRSLGEIAPLVRRPVDVELDAEYPELGVRSFGKGTFHKPVITGAEVGNKRLFKIHEGDLLFSNVFAWEGAIAVPNADDDGRVGSHRFMTFVPKPNTVTANFLRFYLLSPEGLHKVGQASPGGAGRNRTLGIKKAEQIVVPVPMIEDQRRFDSLCAYVAEIRAIRESTAKEVASLIPAMLYEIFEKNTVRARLSQAQPSNVAVLPGPSQQAVIDSPFKEAVLVGAIVKVFHEDGGQPLGNFRLQKGVYFARRFMGEDALDQQYLRKAAGPYNPQMRYSGGMKLALEKNWIAPATGKFGPGHSPGSEIADAESWIEKYQLSRTAAWVRDKFKFKQNNIWELLATVDYSMLALEHEGKKPNASTVLAYIEGDAEWHPKIAKLGLNEPAVQNAMVELETLFRASQDGSEASS